MFISDHLDKLPEQPWVYLFKDKKDTVLYIGKAKNLKKRVSQYFAPGSLRKQEMLKVADHLDFLIVKTESESLYLENNLIKKYQPFYNRMLKGGNGYAYIKLTNHPFAQVLVTMKKKDDHSLYIGPKHHTKELKNFLQYLRMVLQYRTCPITQFLKKKVCSDYYFQLCKGWCEDCPQRDDMQQKLTHDEAKEQYKKLIQTFSSFFKGNIQPIEKELKSQIEEAVRIQNFEWAAKLRDIYLHLAQLVEKQNVELSKQITGSILSLKRIGEQVVFILLQFFEGRLIDVIRDKVSDEQDFSTILSGFELELWELKKEEKSDTVFARSEKLRFTKEERAIFDEMINKFLESYLIVTSFEGENLNNDLLKTLQERYQLKKFPYRIECIDISHLSWSRMSGGLSCIKGGLVEKKGYRKYKIQSVIDENNNDYLALREVIERRFHLDEQLPEGLPDLFVLDGGKGQLGILKALYEENQNFRLLFSKIQFVALGKGEARKKTKIWTESKKSSEVIGEHLYFFDEHFQIQTIPLVYDQADRILIKIRDEAHRFSNAYRKQQMKGEWK